MQPNVMIMLCVNSSVVDVCTVCIVSLHLLLLEFLCALKGKGFDLFAEGQVNGLRNIKT